MPTTLSQLDEPDALKALEGEVIDLFVALAHLLGLPPSVAQIYALLFISREPLSMGDLIERLSLSKGSASQGLRFLKEVGAVHLLEGSGDRRGYYQAETHLKMIVGGYLKREVLVHEESGRDRLKSLRERQKGMHDSDGFYDDRISRLEQWHRQGSKLLPVIQFFLSR